MITVKNVPLVIEDSDEFRNFFLSEEWGAEYLLKPRWNILPDFDNLDDVEKKNHRLYKLPENSYLTGMEVMSEESVCAGFCAALLRTFGLVLTEAFPVEVKSSSFASEKTMVCLVFGHILFDANGNENENEMVYNLKK